MGDIQQNKGHIHVLSCGIGPCHGAESTLSSLPALPFLHEEILHKAEAVFASHALLEQMKERAVLSPSVACYALTASAKESAKQALALCRQGRQVVVLASGDALYHGIGGTLLEHARREPMTFHPHITAFQALFHTLALPWSQVQLFSVHAQKNSLQDRVAQDDFLHALVMPQASALPLRAMAEAPFPLIYGGTRHSAADLAKALQDFHAPLGQQWGVLAERLGSVDERIVVAKLEDLAQEKCHATSMLLCVPPKYHACLQRYAQSKGQFLEPDEKPDEKLDEKQVSTASTVPSLAPTLAPTLALGMDDAFYAKENSLITAADVRAVILARLRLPAWGVLWDVGAGSGSVGLEAAALRPHMQVLAFEQKPQRVAHMQANAQSMGVDNYVICQGHAVENIEALLAETASSKPALCRPQRIFLGGGGVHVQRLLELCLEALEPQGILVASAVTLESLHSIRGFAQNLQGYTVKLSSIDMAHEQEIAGKYHHLQAQNTIYLFTFCQEKKHELS